MHVLLVTGSAPYLGGACTWSRLRECAPEIDFRAVDLLDAASSGDLFIAASETIKAASRGAGAIVAHGAVASMALNVAADSTPPIPVLLLSPVAITKDSFVQRSLRALLSSCAGELLNSIARAKRRRLLRDGDYLRRQMMCLVRESAIDDELFREARERVADARTEALVARTSLLLRTLLTPTNALNDFRGTALFGNSPTDSRMLKRISGTRLSDAWSAPMLESPADVAAHIRSLVKEPLL